MEVHRPPSPTLLLVEDDADDLWFMKRALSGTGRPIDLHVATTGQAALDYLARDPAGRMIAPGNTPALVLCDVNLPLRSGWDVLGWIRSRKELSALPVFIWTSLPTPQGEERARTLGATRYLSKPHEPDGYRLIAQALLEFLGD